jgi:NADH-quinone oxidoreductase subunit H
MNEWVLFLVHKSVLIMVFFAVTLGVAAYATLAERKFAAFFQDRIGPDRAGKFGLLQPLADGVKFFFKEDFIPQQADRFLFVLGPALSMATACMSGAVIPWAADWVGDGIRIPMQIADLPMGVLVVFGVVSLGVYGIMIGGWASNNKYSVLSAIRASSQMVSYELAMGLSLIALVMTAGTMSIREIVLQQHTVWFVWLQPLGFLIFMICSFAEANRTPFDLPECETELIGGYHTEYSSMKLGFYLFAEYINMFVASTVMATLFFGGYQIPFLSMIPNPWVTLVSLMVLFTKIFFFMFVFIWVRWTVPRFRYDQLMHLGWVVLLPLSILNLAITAVMVVLT